jgi:UDP-N-acetylglucosamine 2-epimerase (non-hydrolysing)
MKSLRRDVPRASARGGRTVLCVVGTRPEAIKMAPVIGALKQSRWADCRVLRTGQHRELADEMLGFFGIAPDVRLDVMRPGQGLAELTARLLEGISGVLAADRPEMVLAQGDTTTVLATALACFYQRIPFGHVEAGLRTGRLDAPFPEEANRVLAGRLAAVHFAPTAAARDHLLREGADPSTVHLTGNTVIDALNDAARRATPIGVDLDPSARLVLITAHRRDSFGAALGRVCEAVAALHHRHADVQFLWPVHPNPAIGPVVASRLGGLPRVRLCPPLGYGAFVSALQRAHLVLTDSGGVQEEAPALGTPALVLRTESERPEAVEAGVARLVGTDPSAIVAETDRLLTDPDAHRAMARGASPYGDGQAAGRVVAGVARALGIDASRPLPAPHTARVVGRLARP